MTHICARLSIWLSLHHHPTPRKFRAKGSDVVLALSNYSSFPVPEIFYDGYLLVLHWHCVFALCWVPLFLMHLIKMARVMRVLCSANAALHRKVCFTKTEMLYAGKKSYLVQKQWLFSQNLPTVFQCWVCSQNLFVSWDQICKLTWSYTLRGM